MLLVILPIGLVVFLLFLLVGLLILKRVNLLINLISRNYVNSTHINKTNSQKENSRSMEGGGGTVITKNWVILILWSICKVLLLLAYAP